MAARSSWAGQNDVLRVVSDRELHHGADDRVNRVVGEAFDSGEPWNRRRRSRVLFRQLWSISINSRSAATRAHRCRCDRLAQATRRGLPKPFECDLARRRAQNAAPPLTGANGGWWHDCFFYHECTRRASSTRLLQTRGCAASSSDGQFGERCAVQHGCGLTRFSVPLRPKPPCFCRVETPTSTEVSGLASALESLKRPEFPARPSPASRGSDRLGELIRSIDLNSYRINRSPCPPIVGGCARTPARTGFRTSAAGLGPCRSGHSRSHRQELAHDPGYRRLLPRTLRIATSRPSD